MSIWILLIGLIVVWAALGYFLGGVRAGVTVAGLLIGLMLVHPLEPLATKILPSLGVKNFLWIWVSSPVLIAAVLTLVFFGLSFLVHAKIAKSVKNRADEVTFIQFQRANARVGACAGLVGAFAMFFALGVVVYQLGYATVQLTGDTTSGSVATVNTLRQDMEKTGFDRVFAALDKTSPRFYETADVLGLVYQNPILQSRINNYPPYLTLMERPEIQEIATDKDYNDLIFSKGNVVSIIEHPKTIGLISNSEIRAELENTDVPDLKEYLKTGKSPKYDEVKILGRWTLDKDALVTHLKKSKPDMKSNELLALKQVMDKLPKITMLATVDNRVIFKLDGAAPAPAAADGTPAAAPAPAAPAADPMARYRGIQGRNTPRTAGPAAPRVAPKVEPPPVMQLSGEGTWKEFAGDYQLTVPEPGGKQATVSAKIDQDQLIISSDKQTLVFEKIES